MEVNGKIKYGFVALCRQFQPRLVSQSLACYNCDSIAYRFVVGVFIVWRLEDLFFNGEVG